MKNERSARGAKTLPARFYTSMDVFELETERIFETHWQCAGRSSECPEPGQSILVKVEGENLIIVRNQNKSLRCFFNVCRHRGTRLCESSGQQFRKSITCPYHAWSYDLNGECIAAPNMADVHGFEKSDWNLKQTSVAECQGFIFVSLSENPPPIAQALGPLATRLDDWSLSNLVPAARLDYFVKANWKMLFQNYNECYHCPRVHPALNAISSFDTAANDIDEGPVLGGPMRLADDAASMTTTGKASGAVLPRLTDEDARRVYYFTVFPTLFISTHPDFVLIHRVKRVSPRQTQIACEFLFHPDDVQKPDFNPTPTVEFWDQTNKQDWHVCELSQQGVASRAYEPGPYSELECTLAAFDRHYRQIMDTPDNSLSRAPSDPAPKE